MHRWSGEVLRVDIKVASCLSLVQLSHWMLASKLFSILGASSVIVSQILHLLVCETTQWKPRLGCWYWHHSLLWHHLLYPGCLQQWLSQASVLKPPYFGLLLCPPHQLSLCFFLLDYDSSLLLSGSFRSWLALPSLSNRSIAHWTFPDVAQLSQTSDPPWVGDTPGKHVQRHFSLHWISEESPHPSAYQVYQQLGLSGHWLRACSCSWYLILPSLFCMGLNGSEIVQRILMWLH